jgi:hypothetical protein
LDAAFPDHQTVRSFTVVADADVAILGRIVERITRPGLEFLTLRAARVAALIECSICLKGISEGEARSIRSALETVDGVQRVRLEHRIRFAR